MDNFTYRLKDIQIKLDADNFMEEYLKNLNIEKISSFLNEPDINDEESYSNLEQIDKLIDTLHYGFINNKNFFLQIDSDVDGYTSAAIFYRYFKDQYPLSKIEYRVHQGKEHGVIINTVPNNTDYVIIPDAGSNQITEQYEISDMNMTTIIMDHHLVDKYISVPNTVVVNNQLSPKFKNKFLSGAGVVYKVIQAYSVKYGDGYSHQLYIDLAALGIVSDMMDTRSLDNNFIIYHGLRNIRNPLFKAILDKQSYSISNTELPTKIDIAFYVTPLINAVIRVGTVEENENLFKALVEYDHKETYTHSFRGQSREETLYQKTAREAYNIRNQQNKEKMKAVEFLKEKIAAENLNDNAIIAVTASNTDKITVPKTMTGLIAMDLTKNYKKPTLVLRPRSVDGEPHLYGSGRANIRPGFPSFRDVLRESNLMSLAEGHDMAFGAGIKESNLSKLLSFLNNKLKNIDFGTEEIEVDAILYSKDIQPKILVDFAKYSYLYGTGIPQPRFAFEFLINRDLIQLIGKKQTTLKFSYNNIEFIKFNAGDIINEIFEADETGGFLSINPKIRLRIIGRPEFNEFMGSKNLQILIEHIMVIKTNALNLL